MQNFITFLHTGNEQVEFEILNARFFILAPQKWNTVILTYQQEIGSKDESDTKIYRRSSPSHKTVQHLHMTPFHFL